MVWSEWYRPQACQCFVLAAYEERVMRGRSLGGCVPEAWRQTQTPSLG